MPYTSSYPVQYGKKSETTSVVNTSFLHVFKVIILVSLQMTISAINNELKGKPLILPILAANAILNDEYHL